LIRKEGVMGKRNTKHQQQPGRKNSIPIVIRVAWMFTVVHIVITGISGILIGGYDVRN